jgi:hypothetical protein
MAARRRTAEEWRGIVEDWLTSGRPKEVYAREIGVSPVTLGWWQWKLGVGVPESTQMARFADVVVVEPDPKPAPDLVVEVGELLVRVPSGFDAGELRRLIEALC